MERKKEKKVWRKATEWTDIEQFLYFIMSKQNTFLQLQRKDKIDHRGMEQITKT